MSNCQIKRAAGFSLLEMTIALALGAIVLAAAVQIYIQGLNATWIATQRAEMQENFRAASNILTKDLGLAGAGLGPTVAIPLPSSTAPVYGCDQTKTCYLNGTSVSYPEQGTTRYLYGLLPGYDDGPTLLTAQGPTDIITVVYTDPILYLDCYTATAASATTATFVLPSSTSSNCTAPSGTTPQAVNDAAQGLTAGDLVLFYFGTTPVVAEVTGAVTSSTSGSVTTYTVPFAASDVLNMNQGTTVKYSLAYQYTSGSVKTGYANRIEVITYYIDNTVSPPRLMRQISGHSPVAVAEDLAYLKFTYNLFNTATTTLAVGCTNPGAATDGCTPSGASSGMLPNQVTQINIQNMAIDSSLQSALYGLANGYQRLDLQTSVCPRNLTYVNDYNN